MRTWEDIRNAVANEATVKSSLIAFAQEILEAAREGDRENVSLEDIFDVIQEHADDMLDALAENTGEEIVDHTVLDEEFEAPDRTVDREIPFEIPEKGGFLS